MKKLLLVLIFAFNAAAEVIESNRYADVLNHIDSDTLFVTDLDNTVFRPPQTIGSDQWGSALQKDLIAKGFPKEQAVDMGVGLFALVQMRTQVVPVENDTPSVLRKIAFNAPVLGLTARPLVIVDRTIEQLNSIGVNLTGIPQLNLSFANGTAAYRRGVLFVGPHNNKGQFLRQLLEKNNLISDIRRIVFIDDKAHHAEAMDQAFADSEIEVIAIRYGAADELVKAFDADLGRRQFEIFNRTGQIVPDHDVE